MSRDRSGRDRDSKKDRKDKDKDKDRFVVVMAVCCRWHRWDYQREERTNGKS